MNRTSVLCAAVCLAIAALAMPTRAKADNRSAVAAGVIGGLAVGAMLGAAAAANDSSNNPPVPAYYGPGSPGCYWARQRVWDGYTWRKTRVRVCN